MRRSTFLIATAGPPYAAESKAFFSRASGLTSGDRRNYDILIRALVAADGPWTKRDAIYAPGLAPDAATAILDLKPSANNATAPGSPAFARGAGFTGASGKYFLTPINPSLGGFNFTQDGSSLTACTAYGGTSAGGLAGSGAAGGVKNSIYPRSTDGGGTAYGNLNTNSSPVSVLVPDGSGHWTVSRTANNLTTLYHEAASIGTTSAASGALENKQLSFLRDNNSYFTGNFLYGAIGGALTAQEVAADRAAFRAAFMAAGVAITSTNYTLQTTAGGVSYYKAVNGTPNIIFCYLNSWSADFTQILSWPQPRLDIPNAVIIAPDFGGPNDGPNDAGHPVSRAMIKAVIDQVKADYPGVTKVMMFGYSGGATAALTYIGTNPGEIQAVNSWLNIHNYETWYGENPDYRASLVACFGAPPTLNDPAYLACCPAGNLPNAINCNVIINSASSDLTVPPHHQQDSWDALNGLPGIVLAAIHSYAGIHEFTNANMATAISQIATQRAAI